MRNYDNWKLDSPPEYDMPMAVCGLCGGEEESYDELYDGICGECIEAQAKEEKTAAEYCLADQGAFAEFLAEKYGVNVPEYRDDDDGAPDPMDLARKARLEAEFGGAA
ncbi:MAG: hypothetical protein FWB96_01460 [Defluviitaleaceae bacterium]|nr:hypothetical protein [Defluviitaleaceae bacterium]MCL2261639.1 hypothetical protein [Defluviitaleaceae bacterium]